MHPAAISLHLVSGSLFGANKIPVDPVFFIQSRPICRVISACYIGSQLCGHPGFVHGGLLSLLFDDVFARCASIAFDSGVGMTANLKIDFRKPSIPDRLYVYRAEVVETEGRKMRMVGQMRSLKSFRPEEMIKRAVATHEGVGIEEEEGELVAEASALFVEPKSTQSMVALYPK
ncbi:HotDog domain-containing protein [Talaromyces proteolyticus]|uniref:HotDog domain-containing protein n=1 Tax=Talaromyces proteolyticus TaxID=1131652 RepID=A0AAD4KZ18_9EURO|nr:HotDog domain-containing protein [Talaromyces proteolyticus]KAH8703627.1 HotDog domain-containing protein [Talaromyces proteolyticus]